MTLNSNSNSKSASSDNASQGPDHPMGMNEDKANPDTAPANGPVVPAGSSSAGGNRNAWVSKTKRIACTICRRRKLRCDGVKPSCGTCSRLGHSCAYDEVRKKSGPKRGYVKALEERLKQVEAVLQTKDQPAASSESPNGTASSPPVQQTLAVPITTSGPAAVAAVAVAPAMAPVSIPAPAPAPAPASVSAPVSASAPAAAAESNFRVTNPSIAIASDRDMDRWQFNAESPPPVPLDDFNFMQNAHLGADASTFTWEMIGLGLEEPLPTQETIDELHHIYFSKVHPTIPMVHRPRYLSAMNLAPCQRPPVALRYAIWTLACAITEKYQHFKDLFYQRARKYMESDSIKGYGEHMISVAHAQTHVLLAHYEFRMMYFPRAWLSTGAAVRLCQMIGLHRIDGAGLDIKQCLPPPRDWTEREERRRTFWMAFCEDRYASIGTGWPMMIDEKDIMTHLPASDPCFDLSIPEETQPLAESMNPAGAGRLSSFGSTVLMACLYGRNLTHLHRPDVDDRDHDLNGDFWKRHRQMDSVLLNTTLCLPSHLKLPEGIADPNVVWTNMSIHTSTICLHQAAIFKADKHQLSASVSAESKMRCITAANETTNIMRNVSHLDLTAANPFISFSLYVAARVFVQYLKSRPNNGRTADSLRFLLSAMNALKRRNPLTESFLVQLDVDLETLGTQIPELKSAFPLSSNNPAASRFSKMKTPYDREAEKAGHSTNRCHTLFIATEERQNGTQARAAPPPPSGSDPAAGMAAAYPEVPPHTGWSEDHGSSHSSGMAGGLALTPGSSSIYDRTGSVSGPSMGFGHQDTNNNADGTLSPEAGLSNRATPNPSTTPDRRGSQAGLGAQLGSSNGSSFHISPSSSHHRNIASNMPTGQQGYAPEPNLFGLGEMSGIGPGSRATAFLVSHEAAGPENQGQGRNQRQQQQQQPGPGQVQVGGFSTQMAGAWTRELGGQAGMTPTSEGMLRSLMGMEQMDGIESMDISGWHPTG